MIKLAEALQKGINLLYEVMVVKLYKKVVLAFPDPFSLLTRKEAFARLRSGL